MEGAMEMETEQPDSVCGGAEAVLSLQPTSSVSIAYHSLFGPHDDLILLELDEKLLPDVLDHRVTIRGQPDEDAVLCTQSRTYAVKFVGTSNSVLLIPPSDQSALCGNKQDCDEKDRDKKVVAPVIKVAPGVMELVEVAPRLDRLRMLLSENPYRFDEVLMENNNRSLYGWDDLIEKVQASNDELITGLQALSAVEIDGHWRIVDENYMDGILNMLLHNSVLNDWSLNGLNESEVIGVLQSDGFSHKIAHHCLRVFGSKVEEGVWRLDEKRVCVHFARGILRGGKMRLDNFMGEWMRKIPEGMQASFDMLEGEVLTEKLGIETWVYAFSVSSLPYTPAERFSMLFRERPKWESKDLQPYIRDLSVPGLSSEGLLLKYTRRTQPTADAEPVFSAR
ncbi:Sister chromatid cohesion protein DCC1 [Camellia lanceoleosa]|uniref:Sister chromatid cohesion protein DCC1 n=1 Tax=Camellia lanceoleosa TaxID=1840588 RepID=A0ACC0IHE5_9ERIC|nr:Sister chromatid cohesion protein DCC1 [Camellia lanceoleosa]